ncbi:uncharacterized protein PG998_011876 [Apiospora kogelbergensis]|uniref:uncharacterized protein n=1 Tax=Apiospora kogelbergensis TaxID=1337665 RepID=UPI003131395E
MCTNDSCIRRDLADCVNANGGRTTAGELAVWRPTEYIDPKDPPHYGDDDDVGGVLAYGWGRGGLAEAGV